MREYYKIQSIFKRDEKTHKFIEGEYSLPEFEYLKDNVWEFTEKVDGTNIRVHWADVTEKVSFGGRTDNAQIPSFLYDKLNELFIADNFKKLFPDQEMTLYGEGFGARIQKGGGNYIKDGVSFVLFDVLVENEWWLKREDIEDVATKLDILSVPVVGRGSIRDAISDIKAGVNSQWGDFRAEGLVLKPDVELKARNGKRIITKIKHKDF